MSDYKILNRCLCCDSTDIEILLDLSNQPLANLYHDNTKEMDEYPLSVNICNNCYHIQLTHVVNPNLLFKDYLYVSGTTKTLHDNMKWFVDYVLETTIWGKGDSVLDIACNDGTQLNYFKDKGFKTYGIDPAENLHKLSSENHKVVCDYFNADKFDRQFDVITAQNVFAHNSNPKKFLEHCDELMHDESVLYIQTSQAEMILNNQFDTIYHEHYSYLSLTAVSEILKANGLALFDVEELTTHGGSLRIYAQRSDSERQCCSERVGEILEKERYLGMRTTEYYSNFQCKADKVKNDFLSFLIAAKRDGKRVAAYGAAAKGNTLLNYAGIRGDLLSFIVDLNPAKQGKYTPGTRIPIVDEAALKREKPDFVVILPWNLRVEIIEQLEYIRQWGGVFVTAVPQLEVIT